jgi:hypothetical protein
MSDSRGLNLDTPEKAAALHLALVTGGPVVTYPPIASQRLAHRLDVLRDRHFVGRDLELPAFRAALESVGAERPVALEYVYGPGGVGKSVLLRRSASSRWPAARV